MSLICPCISLAQITKRLGLMSYNYVLGVFGFTLILAIAGAAAHSKALDAIVSILTFTIAFGVLRLRMRVRTLFSIPGTCCEDFLYTFFCGWCSIAQMSSHVECYEQGTCSFSGKGTLEGYTW